MRTMSNLEYSFMAEELASLAGRHFSRIRRMPDGSYRMKLGSTEIVCQLGVRIHKTKYIEDAEPNDKFVQKISKELDNAKLLSIEQLNNDRIISFNFDKGRLVFEMFGKGNAILVKDDAIITAYKNEKWADREIRPGISYTPPSTRPAGKLEASEKYIIVSLMKLPFGKEYALEALGRAGIDEKSPGNKLSKKQLSALEKELEAIRDSAKPHLFLKEGKPFDFSLAPISAYASYETKTPDSLSEAIDEYYHSAEAPSERLEKLEKRLEKQEERLQSLRLEEKENRQKGDYIYEHFTEVEEILNSARKGDFKNWKADKKEKSVEGEL